MRLQEAVSEIPRVENYLAATTMIGRLFRATLWSACCCRLGWHTKETMKFRKFVFSIIAAVALNAAVALSVEALPVTVTTVGVIGEGYDSANTFLSGQNLAGQRFSMTSVFDPNKLPGQILDDASHYAYCLSCSAFFSLTLTINEVTKYYVGDDTAGYFSFALDNGLTQNGQGNVDRVGNYVSGYLGGVPFVFSQTMQSRVQPMNLDLTYDQSRTFAPQSVDSWSTRFQYPSGDSSIYFYVGNGGGVPDYGSMSSFSLNASPVPEPSTFLLACFGLVALVLRQRMNEESSRTMSVFNPG